MKTIISILALFVAFSAELSIDLNSNSQNHPEVGDTLIILENTGSQYRHIDFPRLNILVKTGNLPSYKSIYNKEVVIKEVNTLSNEQILIKLERADGKKFFNHQQIVKANYFKALENNELKIKN